MGISEQAQEILDELYKVNPENLNEKARKLFDTVMEIADERDLYKETIKEAIEYNQKVLSWITNEEITAEIAEHNLDILQGNDD